VATGIRTQNWAGQAAPVPLTVAACVATASTDSSDAWTASTRQNLPPGCTTIILRLTERFVPASSHAWDLAGENFWRTTFLSHNEMSVFLDIDIGDADQQAAETAGVCSEQCRQHTPIRSDIRIAWLLGEGWVNTLQCHTRGR